MLRGTSAPIDAKIRLFFLKPPFFYVKILFYECLYLSLHETCAIKGKETINDRRSITLSLGIPYDCLFNRNCKQEEMIVDSMSKQEVMDYIRKEYNSTIIPHFSKHLKLYEAKIYPVCERGKLSFPEYG